jgi:hypothetical protein
VIISAEELTKLIGYMDDAFAFEIGDIVQPKALGCYTEEPSGWHTTTDASREPNESWHNITLTNSKSHRYQIVERLLQQCHGGVQKHYKVSLVDCNGLIESGTRNITEPELVLSKPFKQIRSMRKKSLQEFVDSLPADK